MNEMDEWQDPRDLFWRRGMLDEEANYAFKGTIQLFCDLRECRRLPVRMLADAKMLSRMNGSLRFKEP